MSRDSASPLQRKGSLLRTVRAVAWSLIGSRKGSEYAQDLEKINPIHIIVVGPIAIFSLALALSCWSTGLCDATLFAPGTDNND